VDIVFDKWREKLLDAGKGNRLINYKESQRRTIDILVPDIENVFLKISNGETLSFFDVDEYIRSKKDSELLNEDELNDKAISKFDKITKQQIIDELSTKIKNNQVLSFKKGFTLQKILKFIRKIANDSISEKGINILYMAFGFLKWKEKESSDIIYSSPLVLIPITIDNDSSNSPFTVCQYEDEINTNPTLLYAMKYNFDTILPEFQQEGYEDETIDGFLSRVYELVTKKGWEVTKNVVIGTFSFLKMNMYKDLQENEGMILTNSNIKKLLNRQSAKDKDNKNSDFIDTDKFFREGKELSLHNVVDADSSQMEAIIQAQNGNSFVLQGPPGTGKSQTITNLIAEFLFNDKRVLFVSEKIEALNVVYNNLKKVGLEDFCLELHSYKTNKKEVISELYRVLNRNQMIVKENASGELEDLKKAKEQLDIYAETLHTTEPKIEKTPYQILGVISKLHDTPVFEYAIPNIGEKGIEYLKDSIAEIENYMKYTDSIGMDYYDNAWYGYTDSDLSYENKLTIKKDLNMAIKYSDQMNKLTKELNKKININVNNDESLQKNIELFRNIASLTFIDNDLFKKNKLEEIVNLIKRYNAIDEQLKKDKAEIGELYNNIFELNLNDYYLKFKNNYISFFRFLNKNYRRDKKIINQYLVNQKQKISYDAIVDSLKKARDAQTSEKDIVAIQDKIFLFLTQSFDPTKTYNWIKIEQELTKLNDLLKEDLPVLIKATPKKITEIQSYLQSFNNSYEDFKENKEAIERLQKKFDKEIANFNKYTFEDLIIIFENCLKDFNNLENWVRFNGILIKLESLGLKDFIDKTIENTIKIESTDKTFKLMFYSQWMDYILNKNGVLRNFSRANQDSAVLTFKEKDKLKFEIAKAEIVSKLSAKRPSLKNMSTGSQVSTLVREANKKRKQKPVRLLLQSIDKLVQTLKPCFLMSPLSVSTYLSGESCKFDVVIFDEASQIFPWDAIGAIYRADQIIVVGDSKQMPPSNYFNAELIDDTDDEDENADDTLDFESILDLCTTAFNQEKLRWHYRSRTEDLITFSNRYFYDGNLITFPSAIKDNRDTGVDFYYVENGLFDRKSKNNIEEARTVVDLVFEHFAKNPKRSLGVVAFSISQQETIDGLIQERREKDDKFADFFDTKRQDAFFVKNLETVQGDERDTIIFSVAYARDSTGKFLHNFGPLNRKGGERRLNVAITRAKYNVKLVTSIKSHDIDLDRTQSLGAKLLKDYLDCAEHGMQNVNKELVTDPNAQPDSEFEVEVYDALKDAGYKVDMQVGCSGYRIDLGVRHPEKSDYVLAVECDGATYHSGKTTRDRDRLRQEVLERLGWKFYRVWSTDWFINNQTEREKLLNAVKASISNFDKKQEIEKDFNVTTKNIAIKEVVDTPNFIIEQQSIKKDLKSEFKEYEYYRKKPCYNGVKDFRFDNIIYELVKTEAPITEELLLRETVECFGNKKVTSVVRRDFTYAIKGHPEITKIKDYYVIDRNQEIEMRIPRENDQPRDIMFIPNVELSNGIYKIIKFNIGINKDGLFRTIANLLGFTRIGENIRNKLETSLGTLINLGKIKDDNGEFFIK